MSELIRFFPFLRKIYLLERQSDRRNREIKRRMSERNRERGKGLIFHLLVQFPKGPHSQGLVRLKAEFTSMQVSHRGSRDPKCVTHHLLLSQVR